MRFASYSPDDLVEIAVRYGSPRATVLDPEARHALNVACRTLGDYLDADGNHGIDLMQNGRFARNVVEQAERLRDSRVAAQNQVDRGSVTIQDLEAAANPGHRRGGRRCLRGKTCADHAMTNIGL